MPGLPWIQVDSGFSSSIAVMVAAEQLEMDVRTFTGAMVDVQDWGVRNLPTGRFGGAAASSGRPPDGGADWLADERLWPTLLERVARWTGAPGAFWDALLRSGFLVREEGGVRLTLLDRYVQVLEKRARDAERKRLARRNAASGGRPADAPGASALKKKKESESERKTSAAAAAAREAGASGGRPRPVAVPSAVGEEDALESPVQRSLHGAHLVPAAPPRGPPVASVDTPEGAPASIPHPAPPAPPAGVAEAFWGDFQALRAETFPGSLPEQLAPSTGAAIVEAVQALGGDSARLVRAARAYLASEYARTRQPVGTALAFLGRAQWRRWVDPSGGPAEASPSGGGSAAAQEWARCLAGLRERGKPYAADLLAQLRAVDLARDELVVEASDEHQRVWLLEQYSEVLAEAAQSVGLLAVRVVTGASAAEAG